MSKAAAFLTYNTVGASGDYPNGVVERNGHQALVISHPRGQRWGAQVEGVDPVWPEGVPSNPTDEDKRLANAAGAAREQLIASLYAGAFDQRLAEMDYVVIYVGAGGSEGAIELAAHLPKEKVRFVFCDCNLGAKHRCIVENGLETVPFLMCECGGRATMAGILDMFLETGVVGPVPALA